VQLPLSLQSKSTAVFCLEVPFRFVYVMLLSATVPCKHYRKLDY
jgi:hypothetical protein